MNNFKFPGRARAAHGVVYRHDTIPSSVSPAVGRHVSNARFGFFGFCGVDWGDVDAGDVDAGDVKRADVYAGDFDIGDIGVGGVNPASVDGGNPPTTEKNSQRAVAQMAGMHFMV